MSQIVSIDCNDVAEFLGYLADTSHWEPYAPFVKSSPWVFRGHGDSEWKLEPSAWRKDGQRKLEYLRRYTDKKLSSTALQGRNPEWAKQISMEYHAIAFFMDLANEIGLSVAGVADQNPVNANFQSCLRGDDPVEGQLNWNASVVALAQHHGIPTRLLDWSRKPLVAAFHAADSARRENITGKLCVWAANSELTGGVLETEPEREKPFNIWCSPARSENPYLHAQSGVFSFVMNSQQFYIKEGRWPRFEEGIPPNSSHNQELLRRITLPTSLVEKLLDELAKRQISKAHLKPTLDNVAATLLDQWEDRREVTGD